MDVRMPRMSGIEATRAIAESVPTAKILMLTVSDEEEDLYEAVKAGRDRLPAEGDLDRGGRQRHPGRRHGPEPDLTVDGVEAAVRVQQPRQAGRSRRSSRPKLTDRELQVLKLVAQGMSNREVAETLFISENTVKNHVRNILEKLHLHSRMEAVVYAVREKLLDIH